jgi:CBS domain-containing protein
MSQTIREVMTPSPLALQSTTTVVDAARTMRDSNIGNVLVLDDSSGVCGIVTDRDIVVRSVAEGQDPSTVKLSDICTDGVVTVEASATVEEAARIMRDGALRRIPVVEEGSPVGIVSLGDLAMEQDPSSALAGISSAPPNI